MWLLAILSIVLSLVLRKLFGWKGLKSVDSKVPHMKGLPLLGNAHQLSKTSWAVNDVSPNVYILQAVTGLTKVFKKERIFRITLGPQEYYILFDAKYIEELLKSNKFIDKPRRDFKFFDPWLGKGVLTGSGKEWRVHRKLLVPAFHFQILDTYQPIMNEKAKILVDTLQDLVGQETSELSRYCEKCTMDIICETAMGYEVNALKNQNVEFIKSLHNLCEMMIQRITTIWFRSEFIWNNSPQGRCFNQSNKYVQEFIQKIIDKRKLEFAEKDGDLGRRPVFLDILFKQQMENDGFTNQDILDEVNTFMFTGQDTTSVALTWTLFLLGQHPEIQDKLVDELSQVFGDDLTRDVTLDCFKELKYLDCVIKESQRLYPSAPIIARDISDDFPIGDGFVLPKGAITWTLLGVLSMNEETFPDPLVFNPDRFTPENSKGRNPFAAIPFSAGQRNCIGQRFALLTLKTVLCNILRNFQVTSLDSRDKVAISPELVGRPSKKLSFLLQPRKYD